MKEDEIVRRTLGYSGYWFLSFVYELRTNETVVSFKELRIFEVELVLL